MSEVIKWVDAPLITRAMVVGVTNAVHHWITQNNVWVTHVNFESQHMSAIWIFARLHLSE